MAQSYQLISTQTLTSGTQSITFSNIPQNYTDLRILFSARVNTSGGYSNVKIGFNGSTSNITWRGMYAYGGTNIGSNTGSTERVAGNANANSSTSATFSNVDVYITNYTSTTIAKNMSADSVVESNDGTNPLLSFETNYWNPGTQAAITSIELTNSASPAANFDAGSTFYLYGIGGSRASGGTITADANYTYHTFTSTGTFTALDRIRGAEALVIAGGGGGSISGGGAGGVFYTYGQTLAAGNSYAVVVGSGGAAGTSGSNSTIASFVATGGGTGGYNGNGGSGGSGGGAGTGTATTYTGGSSTQSSTGGVGYGFAGGNATASSSGNEGGAGGGGGGSVGQNMPGAGRGSNGGAGLSVFHSWHYATSTGVDSGGIRLIAGGGGGSGKSGQGTGGTGGGGNAGNPATNGTANTGGGGGGNVDSTSGSGGSGLVIIRYPNS
jgi:hypothetical protein